MKETDISKICAFFLFDELRSMCRAMNLVDSFQSLIPRIFILGLSWFSFDDMHSRLHFCLSPQLNIQLIVDQRIY